MIPKVSVSSVLFLCIINDTIGHMSTSIKKLSPYDKKEILEALNSVATELKGSAAVITFINHLLTESEKITIGRRVLMAKMIIEGYTRAEIRHKLGVSPNTFSRTRKWLEREIPDYETTLKQFATDQNNKKVRNKLPSKGRRQLLSLADLKHRYPMHFLLLNIIDELR